MFDIASNPDAILAHHARLLIHDYTSSHETRDTLLPLPPHAVAGEPVGILGAGVGGLHTAVILQSLNVSYEIIESSNQTADVCSPINSPVAASTIIMSVLKFFVDTSNGHHLKYL